MPTTTVVAATAVSVVGSGSVAWANEGNVFASDDVRASVTLSGAAPDSEALRVTDWDCSAIAEHAIIAGIEVLVEISFQGIASSAKLDWVELVLGGSVIGTRDDTDNALGSADSVKTYGSSSSLWDAGIVRQTLEDPTFGVQFGCLQLAGNPTIRCDAVTLAIYWARTQWSRRRTLLLPRGQPRGLY